MNYLLVTHIPFARDEQGRPVVDGLWARDLIGLAEANGPIRVVAPELRSMQALCAWGPNVVPMDEATGVSFRGFPSIAKRAEAWKWLRIRSVLREQVRWADVVHTSNLFAPWTGLSYAHDYAVRLGRKTVFVIAEDFHDMLAWEWVRPAQGLTKLRRERALQALEQRVRRSAATASLTMIHTPAAVERFRLAATNSVAIRQPGHEAAGVITEPQLKTRLASLNTGRALEIVTACRHSGLKGLDLLIRAVAIAEQRGVSIRATLYGAGPETDNLRLLAAELGVRSSVSFPGSLPAGPQLHAAIRRADVFLMPHRTTDFGRAFFDAMAAGLPVVAFRTPASSGTVYDGQDGLLAPLDDVQSLAECLTRLHRDRVLLSTLSEGARRRALDNTRTFWFRLRAEWTQALLDQPQPAPATMVPAEGAAHAIA